MFDPTAFSLSDTLRCGSKLRRSAESASTLAGAGDAIVEYLRDSFVDPETDRPAFVLARMFVTRRFDRLDADLQEYVRSRLQDQDLRSDVQCLTLLASRGDLPSWCDPRQSAAHRVIPLHGSRVTEQTPMIGALIEDLGLNVETVAAGRPADAYRAGFDVFHVPEARGAPQVPDQGFVHEYGVRSVLGFGGALASGEIFVIVLFSRSPISASTARSFRGLAAHTRLGFLAHDHGAGPRAGRRLRFEVAARRELLKVHEATAAEQAELLERTLAERVAAEHRARDEAAIVETLYEIGTALSAELEMDRVVQLATHAGRRVTGATWGVFYEPDRGRVRAAARSPAEEPSLVFDDCPVPRTVFEPTLRAAAVFRSADVSRVTKGSHSSIRSYLAVPVLSRTGEVLGAFAFGHPEPAKFDDRHERLAVGIAAQTAIAMDNARLYREQRRAAIELQRSLLPELPTVAGLQVISRYLPAATGVDVGGDWLDLIPIDREHTALVVGDVMGRGLRAAALMGQLRTAIRAYTVIGLSPGVVMYHLNELIDTIPGDQVATCLYAIHDSRTHTLRFANAGHPPPIMVNPDGEVGFLSDRLGPLLSGLGTGPYRERQITFEPGCGLVLYTDGLVENRKRTVTEGMDELAERLQAIAGTPKIKTAAAWDDLIDHLANIGSHDDDIAVLYAHTQAP